MASIAGFPKARTLEDSVLTGGKRSRLSLHFNGTHRRRWLLVQWVSLPTGVGPEDDTWSYRPAPAPAHRPQLATLLDNYQMRQTLHNWI